MENTKPKVHPQWEQRAIILGVADFLCLLASYFFALYLRHDFRFATIDPLFIQGYIRTIPLWGVVAIGVFYAFRLYHSIWSMASIPEMYRIMKAFLVLIAFYLAFAYGTNMYMPKSYYIMGTLFHFCCTVALRFSYRMIRFQVQGISRGQSGKKRRIMVIGAGAAGQALIRELYTTEKVKSSVVCVIDDNANKHGRYIEDVEVVGGRHDIVNMAKKYLVTDIIFAIPSCSVKARSEILDICKETGCHLQTMPGIYQLVNDEVRVSQLRDVEITDLLGREQVKVNNEEILASVFGQVILVTGGGGSIGSELCRQIAEAKPKQLIIFDIYENNAYDIQQELKKKYPELDLVTLIGSVRNTNRIRSVMNTYRPDVVFHAAAHKHVPLMEDSPNEAIKNNVMGTYKTAEAASIAGF